MNKIQLEAALQLAQMDYDANPNQLNEHKLDQARKAWDQFMDTEKQAEKPQKAAIKAEPKQSKAPKAATDPIKAAQVESVSVGTATADSTLPADQAEAPKTAAAPIKVAQVESVSVGTATVDSTLPADQAEASKVAETVVDELEKKT